MRVLDMLTRIASSLAKSWRPCRHF